MDKTVSLNSAIIAEDDRKQKRQNVQTFYSSLLFSTKRFFRIETLLKASHDVKGWYLNAGYLLDPDNLTQPKQAGSGGGKLSPFFTH